MRLLLGLLYALPEDIEEVDSTCGFFIECSETRDNGSIADKGETDLGSEK
jgi:hypothetical protein